MVRGSNNDDDECEDCEDCSLEGSLGDDLFFCEELYSKLMERGCIIWESWDWS